MAAVEKVRLGVVILSDCLEWFDRRGGARLGVIPRIGHALFSLSQKSLSSSTRARARARARACTCT